MEVDFILGDHQVAIEVKAKTRPMWSSLLHVSGSPLNQEIVQQDCFEYLFYNLRSIAK